MVSDGGTRPFRVHVRDPSFVNLQSAPGDVRGRAGRRRHRRRRVHRPGHGRGRPLMTEQLQSDSIQTDVTRSATSAAGDSARLTEETRAAAQEIIARYPEGRSRSALLPMLHLVQSEEGYVSPAGIAFCAEVLGLTKAEVGAVATFYTMYKRRPTGEYLVSVCTNLSCQILGGEEIYARLSRRLGVGHDETTADGLDHAGARRVPGRLRLRAGRHRQLRVLRQPDAGVGRGTRRRAAPRRAAAADPRRAGVHVQGDQPPARRLPRPAAGGGRPPASPTRTPRRRSTRPAPSRSSVPTSGPLPKRPTTASRRRDRAGALRRGRGQDLRRARRRSTPVSSADVGRTPAATPSRRPTRTRTSAGPATTPHRRRRRTRRHRRPDPRGQPPEARTAPADAGTTPRPARRPTRRNTRDTPNDAPNDREP